MDSMARLDDALALALELSPKQRIQLIEQIALSIEHDFESEPTNESPSDDYWGQKLATIIEDWSHRNDPPGN